MSAHHKTRLTLRFIALSSFILLGACGSTETANASSQESQSATSADSNTSTTNANYLLTPSLEVGPYYVDEELNRSNVISDSKTGAAQQGAQLELKIYVHEILDGNIAPYTGVVVDMWEANAAGKYSDESAESTAGSNWLRGLQIADADGAVTFVTLLPGWYAGLAPHIHLALRKTAESGVTLKFSTRAFFDDAFMAEIYKTAPYSTHTGQDTFVSNDRLFNTTCKSGSITYKCGTPNLLKPQASANGYAATLHLYVNPLSDNAASTM